jgi:predicted TIM-barrel fold metal-dependent hydrolase
MSLEGPAFDADNHYYESKDAFTRHVDRSMAKRIVQWADVNGKTKMLVGGKLDQFIPNPIFDPVSKPGALDEYFRGRNPDGKDFRALWGELEPIHAEYQNRDARLEVMEQQGLEAIFLFPTQGVGMEEALSDDPPAVVAAFEAFNRWLDEDWGFNHEEKMFAAPMLTLVDVDAAVAELQRVLDRDARVICVRGAPVRHPLGACSPADPMFDPFWSLANDSGVTVAFHAGDAGYKRYNDWEPKVKGGFLQSPFASMVFHDRPAYDTFASLLAHGLFYRHTNLRVASIEMGSEWVPILLKKVKQAANRLPQFFPEDPIETFRRHCWVAPFYEDELDELKELIGVDHVLFGSDWPHAEGLAEPRHFSKDLERFGYTDDETVKVMRDNARELSVRRPT